MRGSAVVASALLLLGAGKDPVEDPGLWERVSRQAMLGRYKDAVSLARGSADPLVKSYFAGVVSRDEVYLRLRGVVDFDPDLSRRMIDECLPYIKKKAPVDARYAVRLGMCYLGGLGVKQDDVMSFKWFEYAAKKDPAMGGSRLGVSYLKGIGTRRDEKLGASWLKKASDSGNLFATALLGDCYNEGRGVPQNPSMAERFYGKSADGGCLDGMRKAAILAEDRMMRAIKKNDLNAAAKYQAGLIDRLRRGDANGDLFCSLLLGDELRLSLVGAPPDPVESFRCYKRAAASGVSLELAKLAICYETGWGCERDGAESLKLFKAAATAARREKDDEMVEDLQVTLAAEDREGRLKAIGERFGWSTEPATMLGALTVPLGAEKGIMKPAPSRGPRGSTVPKGAKLVLTDVVLSEDVPGYTDISGRLKNVSDESIGRLKVEISLEDSSGKLLGNEDAYIKPDPLEPGAVGTFKGIARLGRAGGVKLEFTSSDRAIPWHDASGKDAHQ